MNQCLGHFLFRLSLFRVLLIGELEAFMFEKQYEKRMQEHPAFKNALNGTARGCGGPCTGVREALRGTINFTGGAVVLLVGTITNKWTATSKRPRDGAGPDADTDGRDTDKKRHGQEETRSRRDSAPRSSDGGLSSGGGLGPQVLLGTGGFARIDLFNGSIGSRVAYCLGVLV
jgi:hypothetical protein